RRRRCRGPQSGGGRGGEQSPARTLRRAGRDRVRDRLPLLRARERRRRRGLVGRRWRGAGHPLRHSRAMPVNTSAVGKEYPAVTYAVGREKVKEYANAVGETNPLHLDPAAARAAGYDDVVAPPMFAVVYQARAVTPGMFDPEVGIDFAMLVHSGQDFRWE